jgi:hypothetical protein
MERARQVGGGVVCLDRGHAGLTVAGRRFDQDAHRRRFLYVVRQSLDVQDVLHKV